MRLSAGKCRGIKPSPAARVLYCLSFFSADKRLGSGIYCIQRWCDLFYQSMHPDNLANQWLGREKCYIYIWHTSILAQLTLSTTYCSWLVAFPQFPFFSPFLVLFGSSPLYPFPSICIRIFISPSLFSVVAVVVVTVSLTFEENPPISFQLLDDPG